MRREQSPDERENENESGIIDTRANERVESSGISGRGGRNFPSEIINPSEGNPGRSNSSTFGDGNMTDVNSRRGWISG